MENVLAENYRELQDKYDELERLFVNHHSDLAGFIEQLRIETEKNKVLKDAFELLANPNNYREKYEEPMFKDDTIYLFEFARYTLNEMEKVG